jgi:hypothetical protein
MGGGEGYRAESTELSSGDELRDCGGYNSLQSVNNAANQTKGKE